MRIIEARFEPRKMGSLRAQCWPAIGKSGRWVYSGTGEEGEAFPGQQRFAPEPRSELDIYFRGRWVPEEDLVIERESAGAA